MLSFVDSFHILVRPLHSFRSLFHFVALRCAALHSIPFRSIPRRSDRSFVRSFVPFINSFRSVSHSFTQKLRPFRSASRRFMSIRCVSCFHFISFHFRHL